MATIVNQKKAIQSLTKEIDDLKMRYNSLICGRMAQVSFPPQSVTSIGDLPSSLRAARSPLMTRLGNPPRIHRPVASLNNTIINDSYSALLQSSW